MEFAQLAQALTPELKAEYLALLKLFESEGWPIFVRHINSLRAGAMSQFEGAPTWDANRIAFGQRAAFDMVLMCEEGFEHYYTICAEELIQQQLDARAEADRSME